jgi:hypothetical protein
MKQYREIPYLLRITALIFIFTGLYAFVHMLLSPLSTKGFFFDPRVINIFVGLGLMARKKIWYFLGILSAGATAVSHIANLVEFASFGMGFVIYFLLGIGIDIFQLYALLGKNIRGLYFSHHESATTGQ